LVIIIDTVICHRDCFEKVTFLSNAFVDKLIKWGASVQKWESVLILIILCELFNVYGSCVMLAVL